MQTTNLLQAGGRTQPLETSKILRNTRRRPFVEDKQEAINGEVESVSIRKNLSLKMTISPRILFLLSLAALFLPLKNIGAYEVLTAQELASHCKAIPDASDSTDGQYCIRYIQGFIDGAVATDARVLINLESELANETYSERVIRLRSPDRKIYGRAAHYAEFCLGDPVPLREVVDNVVSDLFNRKHLEAETSARDIVYASLRKHYACKNSAPG